MAISFQCECGKQMQAKEEFAGRKLKCPKCERIVQIPGGDVSATLAPSRKPARPPLAKPMAQPAPPRPVIAPALAVPVAAEQAMNRWEDRSLAQTPTPWLPGDEARFQAGIAPVREGSNPWILLAIVILAAGGIAAAVYFGA